MLFRKLVLTALLLVASAAQATTIFHDDFNNEIAGVNKTDFLQGWTIPFGTVDVETPGWYPQVSNSGKFVDLDGNSYVGGQFLNSLYLQAGTTYELRFDLAGNQRNWGADIVIVAFGSSSHIFTVQDDEPLTTRSLFYTPLIDGVAQFSFHNLGGDVRGALLDNVSVESSVSAVPEPASYAMLLAGLAGAGAMSRRRKV
jgi:hypothetical protein